MASVSLNISGCYPLKRGANWNEVPFQAMSVNSRKLQQESCVLERFFMRRIPSLDGLRAISILMVVGHWSRFHDESLGVVCLCEYGRPDFLCDIGIPDHRSFVNEQQRTGTISLAMFYVRRAFWICPAALVFIAVICIVYRPKFQ
jgi:hypothetical protein